MNMSEVAEENASEVYPLGEMPDWRLALKEKGITLTDDEAGEEAYMRRKGVHCMFYPSMKKRQDALSKATLNVLRAAGEASLAKT